MTDRSISARPAPSPPSVQPGHVAETPALSNDDGSRLDPPDLASMPGGVRATPLLPTARVRQRRGAAWRHLLAPLVVLTILGLWQAATWLLHLEPWLLPAPTDVIASFGDPETQALIRDNVGVTVGEAVAGFGIAVVVGVGLAWVMSASRLMRDALYPLLVASQAVPVIAISAVLVVAFGFDAAPKIIVVVLYSFFAITVNVYDALQDLDPDLPGLLRTLGASRWDILRTARVPAALPGFFTGARLAIAYSIAAAVYGEFVGATGGLGYALQRAANSFKAPQVFALVVVMAALSLLGFAAVALAERLLIPWGRQLGSRHT